MELQWENPGEGIRGECGWGCHGFLSCHLGWGPPCPRKASRSHGPQLGGDNSGGGERSSPFGSLKLKMPLQESPSHGSKPSFFWKTACQVHPQLSLLTHLHLHCQKRFVLSPVLRDRAGWSVSVVLGTAGRGQGTQGLSLLGLRAASPLVSSPGPFPQPWCFALGMVMLCFSHKASQP